MICYYSFLFVSEFLLYEPMSFPIAQYHVKYDDLNQMRAILLKIAPSDFG